MAPHIRGILDIRVITEEAHCVPKYMHWPAVGINAFKTNRFNLDEILAYGIHDIDFYFPAGVSDIILVASVEHLLSKDFPSGRI